MPRGRSALLTDPDQELKHLRAGASSDNPTYLAQRERIYDGMRKVVKPERGRGRISSASLKVRAAASSRIILRSLNAL
jgi:hypothetical protein